MNGVKKINKTKNTGKKTNIDNAEKEREIRKRKRFGILAAFCICVTLCVIYVGFSDNLSKALEQNEIIDNLRNEYNHKRIRNDYLEQQVNEDFEDDEVAERIARDRGYRKQEEVIFYLK
ncbi:MAG: hypothetical protein FWH10_01025 [Oscillospiraceae bacterium]|nr:hypothetical protein [Oscillospiraceae bacterium]